MSAPPPKAPPAAASKPEETKTKGGIKIYKPREYLPRRASEIPEEKVRWLWRGRLPIGKIILIDGDPDTSKSTLACMLAAYATRLGEAPFSLPGGSSLTAPIDVLYYSAEDGAGDTLVPRLRVAGANMSRVHIVDGTPPTLPGNIGTIAKTLDDTGAKLVIFDPFSAFLDGKTNANSDNAIRNALAPLKEIVAKRDVAALILRHLNKGESEKGKAMYRGSGSIGIIGIARGSFLMAKAPLNPDTERILAPIKTNLCKRPPSLLLRLDDVGEVPHLQVVGETDHTADQLVRGTGGWTGPPESDEERSARKDPEAAAAAMTAARGFLESALANGSVASTALEVDAKENGISARTLDRAKRELGVAAKKIGDKWFCGLPAWTEPKDGTP